MAVLHTYLKKQTFLNPKEVARSLGLEAGQTVIDFGCGPGFWVIPFAEIVGNKGKVFAIDQLDSNLEIIRSKARAKCLSNITYKKAPYSNGEISVSDKADLILISNILSLIENDTELIESTANNAHLDTKLVIIEWNKKSHFGLKETEKRTEEDIILKAKKAGFEFRKLLSVGSYHFGLYFEYVR